MTTDRARKQPSGPNRQRMTQPHAMRTKDYIYGVEKVDGNDAWALFQACDVGDLSLVKKLLITDPRLVNAQFWYQFPIQSKEALGEPSKECESSNDSPTWRYVAQSFRD